MWKAHTMVSFIFDGGTYYVSALDDSLDYRIKVLTDSGTIVYLNIILGAPVPQPQLNVYYPEALDGMTPSMRYQHRKRRISAVYAALLNFLATQYRPVGEYGFAGGWIIGYGQLKPQLQLHGRPLPIIRIRMPKRCVLLMRCCARFYSNGRVYVSVETISTQPPPSLILPAMSSSITPPVFLERLNQVISVSGNFPWNFP